MMNTTTLRILGVALFGVSGIAAAHAAFGIVDGVWAYSGVKSGPEGVEQFVATRPYSGNVLALAMPVVLALGGAVAAGARRVVVVVSILLLLWLFCLVTGFSIGRAFVATSALGTLAAVVSIADIWLWRLRKE